MTICHGAAAIGGLAIYMKMKNIDGHEGVGNVGKALGAFCGVST